MINWAKDRTKRISVLRIAAQLLFLFLIFYISIIALWKGLLLLLILGSTIFLGRFFCGWVCPLGFYMDIMTLLRRLFRIRYWTLPQQLNNALHKSRYIIAAVVLSLALPSFLLGAASLVDLTNVVWLRPPFTSYAFLLEPLQPIVLPWKPPFGALFALGGGYLTFPYVGEILLYFRSTGIALSLSYVFVATVLAVSFKVRRFWCRFCPTGISIAALNRFSRLRWMPPLRLNKNGAKCTKCGICKRVCPVQVTEVYEKKDGAIDSSMCTVCLRCIEMCPEKDCLSVGFGGKRIYSSYNWLEQTK